MQWILGAMKAWVGFAIPAIATAIMGSFEQASGIAIPSEIKVLILSGATSLGVYFTPNKKAA